MIKFGTFWCWAGPAWTRDRTWTWAIGSVVLNVKMAKINVSENKIAPNNIGNLLC